jgi:hypothetical protein
MSPSRTLRKKNSVATILRVGNPDLVVSSNNTSGASGRRTIPVTDLHTFRIPANILAFRTISTLLDKVQQERPAINFNDDEKPKDLNSQEERELRVTTAFANLANTQHDIIAIATNLSESDKETVCNQFHLITITTNRSITDSSPLSKTTDIKMIFTSNPPSRGDNPDNTSSQIPYIGDLKAPSGVDPNDVDTLQNYIVNGWCVDWLNLHSMFTSYSIVLTIHRLYTNTYGH